MALADLLTGYGASKCDIPKIAGTYKGKNLAVCGDAHNVWSDLERLGARCDHRLGSIAKDGFDFMTVNKLVEVFPGIVEHAYSNEAMLLRKFVDARRNEYEFGAVRNTHSCTEGAMHRWPWCGQGTSALGAVIVGVGLGYDKIVLCGIPLDDGHHNGEPPWRKCRFETSEACSPANTRRPEGHWKRAIELAFDGKVKSMSGRTREWLGEP